MANQKYYPTKRYSNHRSDNSIARPVAATNRGRYQKGYQNNLTNATRRTETYSRDKVVIVTESVNVVDFNNDNFTYNFDNINQRTNNHNYYDKRRKK
ncbi:hypothetical protein [Haloplasma contractile]|uniref:Uncharacterized protein n=1 Tax=Haloplasma contractile SSD-17B TaxID=1033810 RepID=F7PT67_9MOLU|nr:hypothetical protein [Haloplasma contractile]ERJ12517.1 hypothetical protein HLPCO_001503 [Haloplasma contractile SSD-17B]